MRSPRPRQTLEIFLCSGLPFNDAPRRVQNGGWARQVTQSDFQVSESISGVNMRLAAGAIRELHWHQAAEWGFMSYGIAVSPCWTPKAAPTSPT
jgi:hypothetical protein